MPVYIDPSRSTNGSGTFGDPRNTWIGVTWTAGETYLQKRGTTFDGSAGRITISAPGTAGNPITLGAYGDDSAPKPRLHGGDTRDIAIIATNHGYIEVADFEISNYTQRGVQLGATGNDGSIARFVGIRRLHIHDITLNALGAGIYAWGSDVTIEDNLIERMSDDGIWLDGRRATIRRNHIRDISYLGGGGGDCIQYGGNWADGAIIEDNILDHRNNTDKQCMVVRGGLETSIAYRIRGNQFLGSVVGAGCLSFDTTPATVGAGIVEQNIIVSNRGIRWAIADTGGRNTIMRNNLFVAVGDGTTNPGAMAVTLRDCNAHNNTVIGFYRGVDVGAGQSVNNVFKDVGDYDHTGTVAANLRNCIRWNVGRPAPTGEGVGNVTTDPLLSSSYRPLPGSPLLAGGADLGYLRDMDGRQARRYIGCYATAPFRRVPVAA